MRVKGVLGPAGRQLSMHALVYVSTTCAPSCAWARVLRWCRGVPVRAQSTAVAACCDALGGGVAGLCAQFVG